MPSKTQAVGLSLVFVGGALGSSARYAIELAFAGFPNNSLISTSIVNLLGALALGFVNSHPYFQLPKRNLFFVVGLLGSFTTMSGLAAISAGADLGLGLDGLFYWLFVGAQLLIGVLLYHLGVKIAGGKR